MAATGSISIDELVYLARTAYVGKTFHVALINAPGSVFAPSDTFATILANEVAAGTAGYERQEFTFEESDIQGFTLNGIPLARKAAVFTHDGSDTNYNFSHVVTIRVGDQLDKSIANLNPLSLVGGDGYVDDTYTEIPLSGGSGLDAKATISVANGAVSGVIITDPGTGYEPGDLLSVATGAYLGDAAGSGFEITVATVNDKNPDTVWAVAALSSLATLSDGNQGVFYLDATNFRVTA